MDRNVVRNVLGLAGATDRHKRREDDTLNRNPSHGTMDS